MTQQTVFSFPGIPAVESATMTIRNGVQPGVCIVKTPPQRLFQPEVGDVRFSCGARSVVFRNCMVESASLEVQSRQMWSLRILDRRWKWRYGSISGRFNIRQQNGQIRDGSERTAQQLATRLLQAMGETRFDVSALPAHLRPAVNWNFSNPAAELQKLCDVAGCVITLGLDDRVRILRKGEGPPLNLYGVERHGSFALRSSLRPDELTLVGGATVFQDSLALEAVGLDTDDCVKPLDQLSYKPSNGWGAGAYESMADVAGGEARNRALESVWKWYRVKNDDEGGLKIQGLDQRLDSYEQILPLQDTLLEQDDAGQPAPAYVTGSFWSRSHAYTNTADTTRYNGAFRIDRSQGIVKFAAPVLKLATTHRFEPASLRLTTTFPVRLQPEAGYLRRTRTLRLPGNRLYTAAEVIERPEMFHAVKATDNGGVQNNAAAFDRAASRVLATVAKRYEAQPAAEIHYAGLVPTPLTGATTQVIYSTGPEGAFTQAVQGQHEV